MNQKTVKEFEQSINDYKCLKELYEVLKEFIDNKGIPMGIRIEIQSFDLMTSKDVHIYDAQFSDYVDGYLQREISRLCKKLNINIVSLDDL